MQGYALIASRMAVHTDLGIFRRFAALNAQNLLYMQAELTYLERKLRELEKLNNHFDDSDVRNRYAHNWNELRAEKSEPGSDPTQWELCLVLREKLKTYSRFFDPAPRRELLRLIDEALASYAALTRMQKARPQAVDVLRDCLQDPRSKDYLLGVDRVTWEDSKFRLDLVTTEQNPDRDHLTQYLMAKLLGVYHQLLGRHYKQPKGGAGDVFKYHDAHIEFIMNILSTMLSSLLPVTAIVVLYLVQNTARRLAIIAGFTASFSLLLTVMTTATRSENFAATAA
jgi:hypothetical protein